MHQVICSTGALLGRPNGRNYRLLADCAPKLRCDGFEFMLYDSWYAETDALYSFLKEIALPIRTWHCEKRIGEAVSQAENGDFSGPMARFEINCELAQALGADRMTIHLWDGMTSDSRFENNLAAYPLLRDTARKHGIDLLVENVVCACADPLTHWRQLMADYPDAHFTYDTKMAAFHGQTDDMYLPENAAFWPNIRHLHINDYLGGVRDWNCLKTLHPGDGQIDFEPLFEQLKKTGYSGDYTVEGTSFIPDGVIRVDKLNSTLDWLRSRIA